MKGGWHGKWTDAEDQVLFDVYPEGGRLAVREILPHRGLEAISKRANKLKVRSATNYARHYRPRVLGESVWGVPVHEYTEPDLALRDWRGAEPGQLLGRVA
jgi:hypothetical protein